MDWAERAYDVECEDDFSVANPPYHLDGAQRIVPLLNINPPPALAAPEVLDLLPKSDVYYGLWVNVRLETLK